MPSQNNKHQWILIASISLIIHTGTTQATEGGGTIYPLGVNTVISGKMPPNGLTSFLYLSQYHADATKDDEGHDKANIKDFDLRTKAISLRLDYVYEGVTFLGARVATRMAVPLVDGSVSFDVQTPTGKAHRSDAARGLGDITLVPIMLGWSSPRFSQMVGVDIFAPTGSYDKDRLFNPGRNIWSVDPWYAFTAYPLEKLEVSAKILYFFNQTNSATDYHSGNEINIDYNLGYNFTPEWQAGLNGYAYKQVEDDKQHGGVVGEDGNRGQVVAIGPSIKYQTKAIGLVLKWQHETLVKNRSEGDRIWFQAAYHF